MHTEGKCCHQPDPGAEGKSAADLFQSFEDLDLTGQNREPKSVFTFFVPVARLITGGAGKVLRTGKERTTAPHAAVPRLVSTRQLCKFLSFQVVTTRFFPSHQVTRPGRVVIYFPFFFFLISSPFSVINIQGVFETRHCTLTPVVPVVFFYEKA